MLFTVAVIVLLFARQSSSLATVTVILCMPGAERSAVAVKVASGADADAVAERLQRIAGEGMEVLTRERSNSIYRLMALEKWGVFGVALLVLAVASLTVVGTIVMIMIDKRDDTATLRTMGARRATVRDIFVGEGHLLAAELENDIRSKFEDGSFFIGYLGHSGWDAWSDERILTNNIIDNLGTSHAFPIVTASSCTFAYFDQIGQPSGAERLVLKKEGGAIAVMATARTALVGAIEDIHSRFLYALTDKSSGKTPTIGDAFLLA